MMMYATTHLLPWRIINSAGTEIWLFLWPIVQFLTTAFGWGHFAVCLQKWVFVLLQLFGWFLFASPVMFHFLGWRRSRNAFWLFCYVSLLHSVTSSKKPMVYEILTCLLHVPRINIFSINPSLHGAKQLVARRVQFCFSSSKDEACDMCSIDTLARYKMRENLNTVFSRCVLWSGKYRKSG
jgi:hypothetical protein